MSTEKFVQILKRLWEASCKVPISFKTSAVEISCEYRLTDMPIIATPANARGFCPLLCCLIRFESSVQYPRIYGVYVLIQNISWPDLNKIPLYLSRELF